MSSEFLTDLHCTDSIKAAAAVHETANAIRQQISKVIVGQDAILDQILLSMFCGGHTLVEGVPGLAKTLIISTVAKTLSLGFSRIQFTHIVLTVPTSGLHIRQIHLKIVIY